MSSSVNYKKNLSFLCNEQSFYGIIFGYLWIVIKKVMMLSLSGSSLLFSFLCVLYCFFFFFPVNQLRTT